MPVFGFYDYNRERALSLRSFHRCLVDDVIADDQGENDERVQQGIHWIVMVHDNQPHHRRNADVKKIAHRKMVALPKVFHDHGDEFKVKEKNQDRFQKLVQGCLKQENHMSEMNELPSQQNNENKGKENER